MIKEYLYNLATDKYSGFPAACFKAVLFIFSLIYYSAVKILIFLRSLKPCRLNCKVISVGNITLGGTGKTTLVEFIARYLKQQGRKVAILSRGYKRKLTSYELRVTSYENMGDEPYMLSKKLADTPVIVDTDRIRAAKKAVEDYGVDTVILDDGFQQWHIFKDLEIVAIDAARPFGNRCLLPRGLLREPLSSLKRADVFVLTKMNLGAADGDVRDFLRRINPAAQIFASQHKPAGFYEINGAGEPLKQEIIRTKAVTLFSGIGDPDSFEKLIKGLDINIGLSFRFADHHNYTREDLKTIINASRGKNIDILITTEKDAARLNSLQVSIPDLRILFLRIGLEIEDEQRFYNRLHELFSL